MVYMKAVELLQLDSMGFLRFSWSPFSLTMITNVVPLMTLPVSHKCQCYHSVLSMRVARPRVLPHGLWSQGASDSHVWLGPLQDVRENCCC